jgi:hypothetical protein
MCGFTIYREKELAEYADAFLQGIKSITIQMKQGKNSIIR